MDITTIINRECGDVKQKAVIPHMGRYVGVGWCRTSSWEALGVTTDSLVEADAAGKNTVAVGFELRQLCF